MGSSLGVGIAKDTRKTKKKEMILTEKLPDIPEEILINILIRFPGKSLMRFKCVSKLWLTLITSRYLTNLYIKSSSSRLFAYIVDNDKWSHYALVKSSSSSSSHDHSVCLIDDQVQDLTMPGIGGYLVGAVRGLVCFRMGKVVRICNLTTRQVVKLPIMKSKLKGYKNVWNYLGYDSVHDEYKVLSLVWEVDNVGRVVRSEYQVLVLGAGASWKKTQCHIPHKPHLPYPPRMAINGVLYYGAWTDTRCMVMSFDLSSQEFNLIELPNEVGILKMPCTKLMNYKGQLAVFEDSAVLVTDGIVNLWVLEDAYMSRWSDKKTFVLPVSQMNLVTTDPLVMGVTNHNGEVLLLTTKLERNIPKRYVMYNLERNEITRMVDISPSLLGSFKRAKLLLSTLWDDNESIMYLEI